MYKLFDIESWERKTTYEYFKNYENPYLNICFSLDITKIYDFCKNTGESLNLCLHYISLLAANHIDAFKFRILANTLVICNQVNAGATIILPDNSIRFCLYEFTQTFLDFKKNAASSESVVRKSKVSDIRTQYINVIHYSVIPWICFTSITHPHAKMQNESIPKITFGKFQQLNDQTIIPMSLEVNHALADAFHLYQFIDFIEQKMQLVPIEKLFI